MPRYVDVALPVPLFRTFTYEVPEEMAARGVVGSRVLVPFGRRTMTGIAVAEHPTTDLERVRPITDLLDRVPLFSAEMIRFAEWMSRYYLAPLGETFRAMLPQGMAPESSVRVRVVVQPSEDELLALRRSAPRQAAVMTALLDSRRGLTVSALRKSVGAESLASQLDGLESRGWISRSEEMDRGTQAKTVRAVRILPELLEDDARVGNIFSELDRRAPKQAAIFSLLYTQAFRIGSEWTFASEVLEAADAADSALKALVERGVIEMSEVEVSREEVLQGMEGYEASPTVVDVHKKLTLTAAQRAAVDAICAAVDGGPRTPFLLHGVTGSGKTQVYIEAIRHALARGGRALMLVPEIALTYQLVERFVAAFGERIVVLHSRMSPGERYDGWQRVAAGGADVVVGARSALFAPLRDLKIVVVDEEHEASYKQYDAQPRYHARDSAIMRAHLAGAVCVLGSATPSVESYYNAERGKYRLLDLPDRVDNAREPRITIVDTATARRQNLMRGSLSVKLIAGIRERMDRREGTILLQNRRGFASRIECSACGHTPMCPNCAVTLTYHKQRHELQCHYCAYQRSVESSCAVCGNHDLRQPGVGTQRVEEELEAAVQSVRALRMDLDTTAQRGAHRAMLASFAGGEVDVLVGTQMVAKGLDFPRVSLVGVISADTQLLIPDFRASERTFQLLTQVAGRAGRRGDMEGEVIIQTAHPDRTAIQASFRKDYRMMYSEELQTRRELNYPPFARFIVIEFRAEDRDAASGHADRFRKLLPGDHPALEILGPVAALIWRLRGQYRYQLVIKNNRTIDPGGRMCTDVMIDALERYNQRSGSSDVQIIVDVDAQGM